MNTPDTEMKKWKENAKYLAKKLKQQKYEDIERHFVDFTESVISSRDTYWNERVEEEVPNALHEYARWLLENPNAEPLQRRAKKNEIACAITNEDNLK